MKRLKRWRRDFLESQGIRLRKRLSEKLNPFNSLVKLKVFHLYRVLPGPLLYCDKPVDNNERVTLLLIDKYEETSTLGVYFNRNKLKVRTPFYIP